MGAQEWAHTHTSLQGVHTPSPQIVTLCNTETACPCPCSCSCLPAARCLGGTSPLRCSCWAATAAARRWRAWPWSWRTGGLAGWLCSEGSQQWQGTSCAASAGRLVPHTSCTVLHAFDLHRQHMQCSPGKPCCLRPAVCTRCCVKSSWALTLTRWGRCPGRHGLARCWADVQGGTHPTEHRFSPACCCTR